MVSECVNVASRIVEGQVTSTRDELEAIEVHSGQLQEINNLPGCKDILYQMG